MRSFPGPYFPVFGLNTEIYRNTGKYGPGKLRIWTLFTQCASEIWEQAPPKEKLIKKLELYEIPTNSKILQMKRENLDIWGRLISQKPWQRDLRDQPNQICPSESAVAVSELTDELLK